MSQETREWLNTQTLIGFTEKRGNAWHYQAALQGDEPNHYVGAIPVEDVERRLFNWEAISQPHTYEFNGETRTSDRQDVLRGDNGDLLGVFKSGFRGHGYKEWLLRNVASILDDDLGIGSAGLLKNGAQGWVSVEVPENITTPEGVVFRPHLIAATSFDGSLATTYKRTATLVVCDNTLAAGLRSDGGLYRVKHTRNSNLRIGDARQALEIIYENADDFAAEVARLCETEVSDKVWKQVLDAVVPVGKDKGRSQTLALKKQDELFKLYVSDDRVAPWNGTAFGVLQAFNTYNHHVRPVRGASQIQRNHEAALSGVYDEIDAKVLQELEAVLAAA